MTLSSCRANSSAFGPSVRQRTPSSVSAEKASRWMHRCTPPTSLAISAATLFSHCATLHRLQVLGSPVCGVRTGLGPSAPGARGKVLAICLWN